MKLSDIFKIEQIKNEPPQAYIRNSFRNTRHLSTKNLLNKNSEKRQSNVEKNIKFKLKSGELDEYEISPIKNSSINRNSAQIKLNQREASRARNTFNIPLTSSFYNSPDIQSKRTIRSSTKSILNFVEYLDNKSDIEIEPKTLFSDKLQRKYRNITKDNFKNIIEDTEVPSILSYRDNKNSINNKFTYHKHNIKTKSNFNLPEFSNANINDKNTKEYTIQFLDDKIKFNENNDEELQNMPKGPIIRKTIDYLSKTLMSGIKKPIQANNDGLTHVAKQSISNPPTHRNKTMRTISATKDGMGKNQRFHNLKWEILKQKARVKTMLGEVQKQQILNQDLFKVYVKNLRIKKLKREKLEGFIND